MLGFEQAYSRNISMDVVPDPYFNEFLARSELFWHQQETKIVNVYIQADYTFFQIFKKGKVHTWFHNL